MDYYSFNRPRRDGWLSWPCWLTSERFTHKVVTRPAVSLAQNRESSPARTGGQTNMLRQLRNSCCPCWYFQDRLGTRDRGWRTAHDVAFLFATCRYLSVVRFLSLQMNQARSEVIALSILQYNSFESHCQSLYWGNNITSNNNNTKDNV